MAPTNWDDTTWLAKSVCCTLLLDDSVWSSFVFHSAKLCATGPPYCLSFSQALCNRTLVLSVIQPSSVQQDTRTVCHSAKLCATGHSYCLSFSQALCNRTLVLPVIQPSSVQQDTRTVCHSAHFTGPESVLCYTKNKRSRIYGC